MGKGSQESVTRTEGGFFGMPGVDTGMSMVKEAAEALKKALA